MEEIKNTCTKGTRILLGNEKRFLINKMVDLLITEGFTEISIPIVQHQDTFSGKVGEENNHMMFKFADNGGRNVCLAPEYTAVVQKLALEHDFKYRRDLKLFYVQECFRAENPQAGRYRQFTQFGVEIINPKQDEGEYLLNLALKLCSMKDTGNELIVDDSAVRGLDYYNGGTGFEIRCEALGAQKQICGGGSYEGGIGFAIGIDRLMLI